MNSNNSIIPLLSCGRIDIWGHLHPASDAGYSAECAGCSSAVSQAGGVHTILRHSRLQGQSRATHFHRVQVDCLQHCGRPNSEHVAASCTGVWVCRYVTRARCAITARAANYGYRCGLLMGARALKTGQDTGIVVTASHNPAADNGVKLVEPTGLMLVEAWEVIALQDLTAKGLASHAAIYLNVVVPLAWGRGSAQKRRRQSVVLLSRLSLEYATAELGRQAGHRRRRRCTGGALRRPAQGGGHRGRCGCCTVAPYPVPARWTLR